MNENSINNMQKNTSVHFGLRAFPGSKYDLWFVSKPGTPNRVSAVRSNLLNTKNSSNGGGCDFSKVDKLKADLIKEFKLSLVAGGGIEVDMDSEAFEPLITRLTQLHDQQLVYPAHAFLHIKLVDSITHPASWFQFAPQRDASHVIWGTKNKSDNLTCKADAAKPDLHVGHSVMGICVSERFKAVVEQHELKGLEFIWLQDKGRYRAPQWYWLNTMVPLGRGLDHEFFDSRKWPRHPSEAAPEWRTGVTRFDKDQLWAEEPFESALKNKFVSLCPGSGTQGLRFWTYRQFLAKYLPDSDFAYGREGYDRFLCFNRKTRDILLASRLITEGDFTPILTWDEAPDGAEILDGCGTPLPGYCLSYTEAELDLVKNRAAIAWDCLLQNPKPVRKASLKDSLKMLGAAKRQNSDEFRPGAKPEAFVQCDLALAEKLPPAWVNVLTIADGFSFETDDAFEVVPTASLASYHPDIQARAKAGDPTFPERLLHVTHGSCGDFHSLDLSSPAADGDCRVIEFDHETLQGRREWPSIAAFLQDVLSAAD